MWIAVILFLIGFLFVYFRLYLPLQYWKDRGIPHPTPTLIVGNLAPTVFRQEPIDKLLQRTCLKYPHHRYFGFYNFSKPTLVILDRELIKQIFIKNFENFADHHDFLPKDVDTFWKKGLFAREGEDWHDMRRTLSPTFTSRKMKTMFHLVAECSNRFVDYFVKKNTTVALEMMDVFMKFNNDVIASCAFGIHCDSLENEKNEFYLMGKKAFDFSGLKSMKLFGNAISPTLSRLFRIKMFSDTVRNFFLRITKETMAYRKTTGLYRPDVMHLLIEAQKGRLTNEEDEDTVTSGFAGIDESYLTKRNYSNNIPITDEDIASQVLVFFFGSYETVSLVLSQTMYELVANMDAQQKLIREVDFTLEQCQGKITYEAIFKMKYLDMVITETMRLWPPPPFLTRKCVKPFIIEPTQPTENRILIEKGIEVILPIRASHRNPKYFENPDKFVPERFSDENKDNIKPFTYFPFGIGPRHCIGNRFALMVMKVLIVNILSHFQVIPVEKTVIPFEQSANAIGSRSVHGYWFGLKPRTDKL